MGTAEFSLKALKALFELGMNGDGSCKVIAVYTQAPKPSGRNQKIHKSAVQEFAEEHGIEVFTPKSLRKPEQAEIFAKLSPDLAVVSSYGLIIPQNILDIPRYGFINIHASALPRWRGAAPIQAAILAGDKQTGITIMKMDAGVDTGDIISMQHVDITPKTTHGELAENLGNLGAKMIVETLKSVENLENSLKNAQKQPEDGAVYAPKISKEDCRIDWSKPAVEILKHVMAMAPAPGAWTEAEMEGLRVKVFDVDVAADVAADAVAVDAAVAGEILADNSGRMFVKCGEGILEIAKIQPAGKNIMSGKDFLRGRANFVGKIFS